MSFKSTNLISEAYSIISFIMLSLFLYFSKIKQIIYIITNNEIK